MSDFWESEMFLQLFVPLLAAVFVTFFTWRLNRTLSQGRPMSPFAKKLLSHGFLLILGVGLFMGWNDQLAIFLGFPGREVWRPLAIGWAVLLLYDATKRLQKERQSACAIENDGISEREDVSSKREGNQHWAIVVTVLRFFLFFAIVGAIGRPGLVAFSVVGAILVAVFLVAKQERKSSRSEVIHPR